MRNDEEKATQDMVVEVLFRTETLIDNDNHPFQTIELIRKGSDIARLKEPETTESHPVFSRLNAGENTSLSPDKNRLIAEVDGYPLLSEKTDKDRKIITISILPIVSLEDDKMEASINFYPSVPSFPELTAEFLSELLIANKIISGHSPEQLNTLLESCRENGQFPVSMVAAKGILPLDGKDSFLRFAFDTGPIPGKIMQNGKIDFRERNMFIGIDKDQTIATLVSPINGTPGITVTGKKIPQIPGKKISLSISDGVTLDAETGLITANCDGVLSSLTETSIKVSAKQSISGNIDYNTGNIESHGAVEISGSVLPGFKVTTRGDLLIHGNVNDATIKCGGNLIIKGGIIGKQCSINVDGDADFNFMEYGRLRVTGKVIIRKQAYYSKIMADGEIQGHENSKIIAGILMSAASINVGTIGSSRSPQTLLAAGIAPGRYLRHLKMRSQFRELEQERLSLLQRYGLVRNIKKRKLLEDKIIDLYHNMENLNLIPGTPPGTVNDIICRHFLKKISIIVQGTIFQETELQIGNTSTIMKKNHKNISFSLGKDNIFIPKKL